MNISCKHCGAKLEQNHSMCPSCHKNVDSVSDLATNKPLDEIKKNLLNMSSKAVAMAKVVGADLANETKQINEARKQAAESPEFQGAENKKTAFKNGARIFWQKLTSKQKVIIVGIPLFFFICIMAALENKTPSSSARLETRNNKWTDDQEVVTRGYLYITLLQGGVSLDTDKFNCMIRGFKKYYAAADVKRALERNESRTVEIADKCIANVNSYIN